MSTSNPLEKGVCDNHKPKKKGFCYHCVVWGCCEEPPVCRLKNHISYQNKSRYRFTPKSLSNNNQSEVSESEQKKRNLITTIIYSGRDRMSLTDELDLGDDGNILSNK